MIVVELMIKKLSAFIFAFIGFLSFSGMAFAYSPDFTLTALDLNTGTYTIDASTLPSNSNIVCQFPRLQNFDTTVVYNLSVTSCGQPYAQPTTLFNPTSVPDGRYILGFDGGDPTPALTLSQTVNISG